MLNWLDEVELDEVAEIISEEKGKEKPVNWGAFWTSRKNLGYTQDQVHAFAKTDSISDWSREMNKIILNGRATAEPEIKTLPSGLTKPEETEQEETEEQEYE